MPLPYALAYCALLKGLLYSESGLAYAQEQIRGGMLKEQDILSAEDSLMENGWKGKVYGIPAAKQAETMIALARAELTEEEQAFLKPFEAVIRYGGINSVPAEVFNEFM